MILERVAPTLFALLGGVIAHAAAVGVRAHERPAAVEAPALTRSEVGPSHRSTAFAGPFRVELVRVVDGDTFEARIPVWFGHEIRSAIRIRGFDAPERAARCPEEARGAAEATGTLADILESGQITLSDVSADKYFGRIVSTVTVRLADGVDTDVASLMLAAGMGRPYAGGARQGWCGGAQRTAMTGVPTRTRSNRSMTSSSYMRMQP